MLDTNDTVLDYRPRDLTTLAMTCASFASPSAVAAPADVHDYDFAVFSIDPSQMSYYSPR